MEVGKKVGIKINFAVKEVPKELEAFNFEGMTKKDIHYNEYVGRNGTYHGIQLVIEKTFTDFYMYTEMPFDIMNTLRLQLKDLIGYNVYMVEE